MVVIPETDIFLIESPLQIDNKNQLTFTTAAAQETYFLSLNKLELDDATYQRKDGVLRFNGNFEDLIKYNYCMYKNSNYSNKWFYAFIVGMEYKNENCTYIYLKTDVFQTWQFDIIYKQSFIEREMIDVASDLPGANLLPETLETGEYKIANTSGFEECEPLYVIAYGQKDLEWDGTTYHYTGGTINGIFSGLLFIVGTKLFFDDFYAYLKNNALDINIITAFTIPKLAAPYIDGTTHSYMIIAGNYNAPKLTKTLTSTPSQLDGYTPRNKKLLQYPFVYLGFNPANGSQKIYRYEDFTNGTPSFDIMSEIAPDPTVYFVPKNYRGQTDNLNDACSLNGYPTISFSTDYYNSYIAQNLPGMKIDLAQREHNVRTQNITSLIGAIGGLTPQVSGGKDEGGKYTEVGVSGSFSGLASTGIQIYSNQKNFDYYQQGLMAEIEKHQLMPDSATMGNTNATLLGYNMFTTANIFSRYNIKSQFAQRIDKYFDMYGYSTNTVKLPNISNRPNWNYIKMAGANLLGEIPETDLQEIKTLFNEGITLWHNPATFLDYSQNNR